MAEVALQPLKINLYYPLLKSKMNNEIPKHFTTIQEFFIKPFQDPALQPVWDILNFAWDRDDSGAAAAAAEEAPRLLALEDGNPHDEEEDGTSITTTEPEQTYEEVNPIDIALNHRDFERYGALEHHVVPEDRHFQDSGMMASEERVHEAIDLMADSQPVEDPTAMFGDDTMDSQVLDSQPDLDIPSTQPNVDPIEDKAVVDPMPPPPPVSPDHVKRKLEVQEKMNQLRRLNVLGFMLN